MSVWAELCATVMDRNSDKAINRFIMGDLMGVMGLMGLMGEIGPIGLMEPMGVMGLMGLMGLISGLRASFRPSRSRQ